MVEMERRRDRRDRRRSRSGSRSRRDRSRGRRRRRRKGGRRRRDRSISEEEEDEEQPKMFWDGYQWHFNDTNVEDVEEHVTSIIRNNADAKEPAIDTQKKMENAAEEALKSLKAMRAFS